MKNLSVSAIELLLILSACNPKYYAPNTQNVPLISQKEEVVLTLAGNANQVEFQVLMVFQTT